MEKKSVSSLTKFQNDLITSISKVKKPLVWIESYDYSYVLSSLCALGYEGWIWNESSGIVLDLQTKSTFTVNGQSKLKTDTFSASIYNLSIQPQYKILVVRVSEQMFSSEPKLISTLQDFVYDNNQKKTTDKQVIVLISNIPIGIAGLEHICEHLSVPLPDKSDIYNELVKGKDENGRIQYNYPFSIDFLIKDKEEKNLQDLIGALYGMTLYDIKDLLNTLCAESDTGKIRQKDKNGTLSERVTKRKKQLAKNSGLLEVIDYNPKYDECVGGIDGLREFLEKQSKKLLPVYLRSKLPKPKGILLVGTPGCGKSESAIATASILKQPLYRINIGELLGHKYGQSENRFNEALRTADASAPCVLWIDEIEKAFAGAGNEQENDDTLTHIVGRFLTWMQEHKTLVYLVATANNLSKMRPEMLRKGRWDEIFYLSYPDPNGIKQIIARKCKEYKICLLDDSEQIIVDDDEIVDDDGKVKMEIFNNNEKLSSIIADIYEKKMSGAEIVSILVEAAYNTTANKDTFDENSEIAFPVKLSQLQNILDEARQKEKESEVRQEEKDVINPEILSRIDQEILELKIRHLNNLDKKKEYEIRNLLKEKYTPNDDAYYKSKGYKSASKS